MKRNRNITLRANVVREKTRIRKLVDRNPRRRGSWGARSFALIKNGMSYAAYLKRGGRNRDLRYDLSHGYVELVPAR